MSHPSWVCGLKQGKKEVDNEELTKSHPSWVCGLKLLCNILSLIDESHTLRGCVDWNMKRMAFCLTSSSHTLRGCVDWNLPEGLRGESPTSSHPSWVCGLKQWYWYQHSVIFRSHPSWVCGLKLNQETLVTDDDKSHPSWVCGLKHDAASLKEVEPKSHPSWVCGLKLPGSYQRAGA